MRSKISSDCLPSYIKATRLVFEIFQNGWIVSGQASYILLRVFETCPVFSVRGELLMRVIRYEYGIVRFLDCNTVMYLQFF
jgi:hypothetical protein